MKVVVIGGKGHIGTFLCPMLCEDGFEVICITRGKRSPYHENPLWEKITQVTMDRENDPEFETKVAAFNPDYVIDLISFTVETCQKTLEALKKVPNFQLYLYCSSLWTHGKATMTPLDPDDPKKDPICDYGKKKLESEKYLLKEFKENKFPVTIIEPGHISGAGWKIINPWGNLSLKIFQQIADGEEIVLPNFGCETLHHVHGYDVAQCFFKALKNKEKSVGERFSCAADNSVTTYGYALHLFEYFGKEPKIKFISWEEFKKYLGDESLAQQSYEHLARSGAFNIEKNKKLIGYQPKYTVWETFDDAVGDLVKKGLIVKK